MKKTGRFPACLEDRRRGAGDEIGRRGQNGVDLPETTHE